MGIVSTIRLRIRQIPPLQAPLERFEGTVRTLRSQLGLQHVARTNGYHLIRGGTVTIEAPDFQGVFTLDAQSHLFRRLAQEGSFEPACAAAVRRTLRLDRDAIDVGANVGFFSVLFGKLLAPGKRVLAIEPVPAALGFLRANIELNGLADKVEVFEGAAGATKTTQRMELVPGREEYSALHIVHPSVAEHQREAVDVGIDTIDALVEARQLNPGFIKVDVEGSELLVLRGAEATLQRFRPHLLVEYAPKLLEAGGFSGDELLATLKNHGYGVEWLSEGELLASPSP